MSRITTKSTTKDHKNTHNTVHYDYYLRQFTIGLFDFFFIGRFINAQGFIEFGLIHVGAGSTGTAWTTPATVAMASKMFKRISPKKHDRNGTLKKRKAKGWQGNEPKMGFLVANVGVAPLK